MRWTGVATTLLLLLLAISSKTSAETVTNSCYASTTESGWDDVERCVFAKDQGCLNQLVYSGRAIYLQKGTNVEAIGGPTFWGELIKIRPRGSSQTYWLYKKFIQ